MKGTNVEGRRRTWRHDLRAIVDEVAVEEVVVGEMHGTRVVLGDRVAEGDEGAVSSPWTRGLPAVSSPTVQIGAMATASDSASNACARDRSGG